jgi:hypothetical protein
MAIPDETVRAEQIKGLAAYLHLDHLVQPPELTAPIFAPPADFAHHFDEQTPRAES